MLQKTLLACALLLIGAGADATRVLEQPERPYELSLEQITLPSTTSGGLTVKPCEDCPYSTHVLTSSSLFYVNDQLLPYAEFSRIAEELRAVRSESFPTFVAVFVDVESGRVTRVKLRNRGL